LTRIWLERGPPALFVSVASTVVTRRLLGNVASKEVINPLFATFREGIWKC
jgi:hypothetical protein